MTELETSTTIIQTLLNAGFDAVWAGGCVRDTLLCIPPNDYDVATNARLEDIKRIFPHGKVMGAAFGIVQVKGVEIAPYRVDIVCDGRHAKVSFVDTIDEDLARRDLTINAMAMRIDKTIIDLHNGIEDLANKIIRFVGDPLDRLEEDYLRGLRAVRFANRFNFTIEPNSMQAIQQIANKIPHKISSERILMEFEKMV